MDVSRSTATHGGAAEIPSRTLPTLILYPTEKGSGGKADRSPASSSAPGTAPQVDAEPVAGPWPFIVFAHGSTRKAEDYLPTMMWWASAGYVVVAPNFPLSTEGTAGGTLYSDYPEQTRDETFVIDSVLADQTQPLRLGSLVDAERIGLGGQSFGAITTLGTVASQCCADPRIRAATEFAGMFLPYPSGDALSAKASSVPVLFVHGDADPTVPYQADHDFWSRLGAPGGFLTLVGAKHDDGYFGGGSTPLDRLVSDATLAFYDQHLKDDPGAADRLAKLVDDAGPGTATLELS